MNELPDDDATVRHFARSEPADGADPVVGDEHGGALPAGTRLGEFEIRSVIGEGGFSVVYLAWDHSLHRNVALKEYIPAEFAMRDAALRVTVRSQRHRETFEVGLRSFVNEARLLASFDHPSLVKVHRFWEDRGTAFMVMPWYQGPTLKQALAERGGPPAEAWLMRLLDSLTEALAVLHASQCYHRDIAPDNIILVGAARTPLLLDFGAARRVIGSMTHDLTAILKSGYAPMEQYGDIPGMQQGPWTDLYALAAVVHYAMRRGTPPAAVGRLVDDTYRPLLGSDEGRPYSPRLLGAIDRALAVRPEQRTRSVEAFRRDLGLEVDDAVSEARQDGPTPAEPPHGFVADALPASAPIGNRVDADPASTRIRSRVDAEPSTAGSVEGMPPRAALPRARPDTASAASSRGIPAVAGLAVAFVAAAAAVAWWWQRTPAPASAEPTLPVARSPDSRPATPSTVAAAAPGIESAAASGAPAGGSPVAAAAPVDEARLARARAVEAHAQASRQSESLLTTLQQLGREEGRDVGGDVRRVRERLDAARLELDAGRFDGARVADEQAQALASQALTRLADDFVGRYGRLAEQATAANQLDIAQQALDRARKVAALKPR